jgi:hypothetical protein
MVSLPLARLRAAALATLSALAAFLAGVLLLRRRFDHEIRTRVERLRAEGSPDESRALDAERVTVDDYADLPEPVRGYFENVLTAGEQYVRHVRLQQRGEFRLGDDERSWRPLTATQEYTTRPPGFVWDARVSVAPLLPARVVDQYAHGEGVLRAKLLGVFPVASAGPSPEMNEGELLRYLAEAVWFPTALLPAFGVEWERLDESSARATLSHAGVTASAVFHFENDEIVRVTADRYRADSDRMEPWSGHFRAYDDRDGLTIPTAADVGWEREALPYWRASVVSVAFTR